MVPEISDRIVEIDRAMRWGYANALGPFELWDALGVAEDRAAHAKREGRAIPGERRAHARRPARKSFYRAADRDGKPRTEYFDLERGAATASSSRAPASRFIAI